MGLAARAAPLAMLAVALAAGLWRAEAQLGAASFRRAPAESSSHCGVH
jgi:hypothetical protein